MSGSRVSLAALLARLHASPQFDELQERLQREHAASLIHVPHAAKGALGAALARDRRLVWIARNPDVAEKVADSLRAWSAAPERIVLLEPRSSLPYERGELVVDESAGRVAALAAWASGETHILVTSLLAALQNSADPKDLVEGSLPLVQGMRLSLDEATERVAALGYERVSLVGGRGEYARRGGILDCFPAGAHAPMRVEWFGDEIESIRVIDPATQRSGDQLARATLLPASEFPLTAEVVRAAKRAAESMAATDGVALSPTLLADAARWEASPTPERGDGIEIWAPLIAPTRPLDRFDGALVILDEPSELISSAESLARQSAERFDVLKTTHILPPSWPAPIPNPAVTLKMLKRLGAERLELTWSSEAGRLTSSEPSDLFGWHDPLMPAGRTRALEEGLESWRRDGARVVIVSEQAGRLSELLAEAGAATPVSATITGDPKPKSITLLHGGLDGGFQGGVDGLTIITDRELFGATRVRRAVVHRRGITREAAERLAPGDLLVHIDHGLGRFVRMVRRGGEGDERDYLEIEYGGGDRVFVPTEQLARIARYTGAEDPALSRLGGGEWRRAKERAQRAADELAEELLHIYAARELAHRPPIEGDSPWLVEFEAAFPFRETPDQLAAIEATKADLAKGRPMDRVIVGDVGYGKTEVALRAAFAALEAGRQVALLVPTTILALQHVETFRRRLAAYPFTVELLSRSISPAKQAEVVAGLNNGSVDLVVATHRLLSKDVSFSRLGLLIVDEEHRFGVSAKERLKSIRAELDVMTLTATPIPRTLNLALSGIRDLSTIETPPEDRHPVATRVAQASLELVRDALARELERGGQSYYVHNRVESIEAAAEQLRGLLPDARIAVGHGQMESRALERVMGAFVRGETDILVCTTIIESGLDIPNANTIIVDRADMLGLAQLYQLRGRVGRSSRRAWCYLLYRQEESLSDVARKRLKAIFDAAHLGAGFQLALADLEIRGAGDLLGGEQSGHIAAVGFDLYSQLLAESVEEKRAAREGRAPMRKRGTAILDLPVTAHLPSSYVEDEGQRLDLYRRLGAAQSAASIRSIADEMRDRFGAPPAPAQRLLEVAQLRADASDAGLASILRDEGRLVIRYADLPRGVAERVLADRPRGELTFQQGGLRTTAPASPDRIWRLAVEIVGLLAAEGRRLEAAAASAAPLA